MKVVFVGPSLAGTPCDFSGLDLRGPAANGDIARAVVAGARAIGLIDGVFGSVAAVWHKEILFALDRGVRVLGAASMGALRAAECAPYGMEPVGIIARRYLTGELDDDAAVALTHLPELMGWAPLTEPLVDVEPTLGAMRDRGVVAEEEAFALRTAARAVHFTERTVERIFAASGLPAGRSEYLAGQYHRLRVSQKAIDARMLVRRLRRSAPSKAVGRQWAFAESPMWKAVKARIASA